MPPPSLCQSGTFMSESNPKQLGARNTVSSPMGFGRTAPPEKSFQGFGTPWNFKRFK